MNKKLVLTIFTVVAVVVVSALVVAASTRAQTSRGGSTSGKSTVAPVDPPATSVPAIASNLSVGMRNDQVLTLQLELQSLGYFPKSVRPTGYFGSITKKATIDFQAAHGLPTTGFVGPLTKATLVTLNPSTVTGASSGTPPAPPPPASAPNINSVAPYSGPVLTTVTLSGSGFTATGNNINFAGVSSAVTNLSSSNNGTTLTFAIPATPCSPGFACAAVVLSPGTYSLSVTNQNGTSNLSQFTVTGASSGTPILR